MRHTGTPELETDRLLLRPSAAAGRPADVRKLGK